MSAVQLSLLDFDLHLRDALADCVSTFHQLLYIASFLDPHTDLYTDPTRGVLLPHSCVGSIKRMHTIVWEEYLSLSLQDQYSELNAYLSSVESGELRTVRQMLANPATREALAPPDTTAEARELMSADLQLLIAIV